MLNDAKELNDTVYDVEAWCANDNDDQEYYTIKNAWFKGDIDWLSLNANGDFTEESFTMGFMIENMDMGDKISDGESW